MAKRARNERFRAVNFGAEDIESSYDFPLLDAFRALWDHLELAAEETRLEAYLQGRNVCSRGELKLRLRALSFFGGWQARLLWWL